MGRKKRSRAKSFFSVVLIFGVVFATALFGIQFITKTGFFRIPGVVYYDESLKSEELTKLQAIFTEEIDLDKDLWEWAGMVTFSMGKGISEIDKGCLWGGTGQEDLWGEISQQCL